MYSRVIRTHQKIDKTAYRHLQSLVGSVPVIGIGQILHYEGGRGPDAPRLYKSGSAPWHYYDPVNDHGRFAQVVTGHYSRLVRALTESDSERASFEAAWLAHALVDGLTPPHQLPVEAELEDLHELPVGDRRSVHSHLIVRGHNWQDSLVKNLRLNGPRGLLTAHTLFELGAGIMIKPLKLKRAQPQPDNLYDLSSQSYIMTFERYAREIDGLHMHHRFVKGGWTPKLANDIRRELAPRQVRIVTLSWCSALVEAGLVQLP